MAGEGSQDNKLGLPQSLLLFFPPPAPPLSVPQFPCLKKVDFLLFASTKNVCWSFCLMPRVCWSFCIPQGSVAPRAQELPQEVATFQRERGRHFWGSAGALRPSLRACLEGTCEKHKLLGEFCALQSTELCLDSFPTQSPWCCGSP